MIFIGTLILAVALIVIGYMMHWRKIVDDIIREEKSKVWADADEEIEARAEERAKEILKSIRYTKRVELINESDIDWGEEKDGG